MKNDNKTDDKVINEEKTNEIETKDKKEIKKSSLYLKLQKPIRIIGIIVTALFMLFIPKIKESDRILDFDMTEPRTVNIIHGLIFDTHVGEVVTAVSNGIMVALGAALVSFILAWIWDAFNNDTWHKYQNVGLCICGFIGLYFPIANFLIGGGKLVSSGFMVAAYVIVVIISIALAVFNVIKFKDKKDVYASEKKLLKIGPMVLILLVSIGAFVYPVISLADDYIEVNEIRQLIKNHPDEYRDDVGEQMGNYAMGKAFAYREGLYVVDEIRKEDGCYGVYRIDREGNYDLVWRIDGEGIVNRLVVYDGYMYVSINDQSNGERKAYILRSGGGDNQEVVVAFDGMVDFGISDNQLIYYEFLDRSGNLDDYGTVYTVDLEKPFDDSNKALYDKRIAFRQFDYETWMNVLLYNKQVEYHYYGKFPQSYENATLYINDHRDLMKSIYPEETNGDDYGVDYYHAIDSNVYAFNIYDDRIYYVKAASDDDRENIICSDNELWVCNMNGEDRRMIGLFPSDSGVENEVIFICDGLYVTEDYVVCDFYRGENGMRERYMMRIDGGYRTKIY